MTAAPPAARPAASNSGAEAPTSSSCGARAGRSWLAAHAGLLALVGILVLALVLRLAFAFRAPPFVVNDSLSYLLPGFDLLHGSGFQPILKRPPLYPLFVGGVFGALGEDTRLLVLVQHLLGVVTVLLSYGLGRVTFGVGAGLLGALLTAVSGPVIVTEHYVMSESLFTLLLLAGVLAAVLAVRAQRRTRMLGWLALAGVVLGLAALTRPIAQLVLVLAAIWLLLMLPRWRPALSGLAVLVVAFGAVVTPWVARNLAVQGTFAIAGGSGEGLAVRTIRYEQRFDFRDPASDAVDRQLARARRIYRDEADDGSAFLLRQRLIDELGVPEVEAERLMRTIALQAILKQPVYYLTGTAEMFVTTFVGRPIRLRQDWLPWRNIAWEDRVEHLLPAPTPVEDRSFAAAEWLVTRYDPARVAPLLALLGVVGIFAGVQAGRRSALLLGAVVVLVLFAGAALIGIEWRYRFPLDPLVNILAAGGLFALVAVAPRLIGRILAPRDRMSTAAPSVTTPAGTTS